MDRKQYLAMAEIMGECREFSARMFAKMMKAGIICHGNYHLKLDIGRIRTFDGKIRNISIGLESAPSAKDWLENRMEQEELLTEGWVVKHDPITKDGTTPFRICPFYEPICGKPEGTCEARGTARTEKTHNCDSGMWFHDDDGDLPMVDRGGVNGNLADT